MESFYQEFKPRMPCSRAAGRKGAYGKIQGCMDTLPKARTETPPPIFGTFIKGFNAVASRVWLILPPVLLDLFLWFGPHLSLKDLYTPILSQMNVDIARSASSTTPANLQAFFNSTQEVLVNSNLMTALRSYPIGIPSLVAILNPVVNPLGIPVQFQIPSAGAALMAWLVLTFIGVLLGSIYFSSLANAAGSLVPGAMESKFVSRFGQVLIFTLVFYAVILFIGFPVATMLLIAFIVNPIFGQIVFMVGIFLVLWFLMPLVFSPFGIFTYGQTVINSTVSAFQLVRGYLRGTGLFVLIALMLEVIVDNLWIKAPANNWLMLLAIGGHAFISTALITSMFTYYLAGMRWMHIRTSPPETIAGA
jgi:hypothetical protein